jgi:hypothetical protein
VKEVGFVIGECHSSLAFHFINKGLYLVLNYWCIATLLGSLSFL